MGTKELQQLKEESTTAASSQWSIDQGNALFGISPRYVLFATTHAVEAHQFGLTCSHADRASKQTQLRKCQNRETQQMMLLVLCGSWNKQVQTSHDVNWGEENHTCQLDTSTFAEKPKQMGNPTILPGKKRHVEKPNIG